MNVHDSTSPPFRDAGGPPATAPETLARELAERLGDEKSLPFYRAVATRYPERRIRLALDRALAIPRDKVRVSRGALFNWLVRQDPDPAPRRTLGIDPGTAHLGYAVIEGTALVAADVADVPVGASVPDFLAEGRVLLDQLVSRFEPDLVVIEHPIPGETLRADILRTFGNELKALARRRDLPVRSYIPTAIKKYVAGHGHAPKETVAETLARRWPELTPYLEAVASGDTRWQHMFDALAVALTGHSKYIAEDQPVPKTIH